MRDNVFDGVIFDLDGVITKTALVHSRAWKKMFDDYLREREKKYNEPFREFTHENDYLQHVDGKPRYEGVKSFLRSRNISIPYGKPDDSPEKETICGIGNRKNIAFNEVLRKKGVETYGSTINLINELIKKDIKTGVASSSKNCQAVLEAAGISGLFQTRVDGVVSAELKLKGKPEPDIFTTAADNLGVSYDRCIVVEDAVSGVQAGARGNFGLVLGIARENNEQSLKQNGADIVVRDLDEIDLGGLEQWFKKGLKMDSWSIAYHDYDRGKEKTRETLMTVGNGYFGTRGAMEETIQGIYNYPGTYISGIYNRLKSKVAGKEIENEDLVNVINWLPINFRIGDGPWQDINKAEIVHINRKLDFRHGVLSKTMIIRDGDGKETKVESLRIASMDNPHLAAIKYTIKPLNYTDKITVLSGLHGDHLNGGVERYRQLNQQHLKQESEGGKNNMHFLSVRTTQSKILIAAAAKIVVTLNDEQTRPACQLTTRPACSEQLFSQTLGKGDKLTINKIIGIATSKDSGIDDPVEFANEIAGKYESFEEVFKRSLVKWESIWDNIDIQVEGDRLAQKLLRMHLYHMIVTTSPHNTGIDFGIPARGLHGEAYRGHIFWDELFILPFYILHFPEVARSVLMYRYRRLDQARKYANDHGYNGAMYPWQSGSDGREETQVIHLNPVSGEWGDDYSSLQRHVSLAIAYNIWQYYYLSGDAEFLNNQGAEMIFEICRFWASKCKLDKKMNRYSTDKVMGPDEFHEKYPGSKEGGLRDNAYTNLMIAWLLGKAIEIFEKLPIETKKELERKIQVNSNEVGNWDKIRHNLKLIISEEGIISQYDGYFDLEELDWEYYRRKYGNIYRMDRLLKAEGKSPDNYKVSKQADTLMTFYNLTKLETDGIFSALKYELPPDYPEKNLSYYLQRTSHGSTLSRIVHAFLANMIGERELSWDLYLDALTSDYQDIQGGTTGEGIHAGVMAGTVMVAIRSYAGMKIENGMIHFDPKLPEHWRRISFRFIFRTIDFECEVSHDRLRVKAEGIEDERITISYKGIMNTFMTNTWVEFSEKFDPEHPENKTIFTC